MPTRCVGSTPSNGQQPGHPTVCGRCCAAASKGAKRSARKWTEIMSTFPAVVHVYYNGTCELDEASNTGTGRWYVGEFFTKPDGETNTLYGYYDDEYTRVDGEWLFANRTLTALYQGQERHDRHLHARRGRLARDHPTIESTVSLDAAGEQRRQVGIGGRDQRVHPSMEPLPAALVAAEERKLLRACLDGSLNAVAGEVVLVAHDVFEELA